MSKRRAFTLIELLVVVAIIALLVSILLPSLARAKVLAKRAVCGSQTNSLGKAGAIYVASNSSYPLMGCGMSGSNFYVSSWPKIYGIMQSQKIPGTGVSTGAYAGLTYYGQEVDEAWPGGFCPAMNPAEIIKWVDSLGGDNPGKTSYHKAAIGYQWNICLRAQQRDRPYLHCGTGRWNTKVEDGNVHGNTGQWQTDWPLNLGGQSDMNELWIAQAVSPDEVKQPSSVAEAWDSWDLQSTPWGNKFTDWSVENMSPGWHVGPFTTGTNGWVALNRYRHAGSPEILYADGHAAADATKELQPSDLGSCPISAGWNGCQINSWGDYDSSPRNTSKGVRQLGTLNHIVPRTEFLSN